MSTTPQEMLKDCDTMLRVVPNNARRRAIISRVYYAAFHFMNNHPCTDSYIPPGETGIHKELQNYLKNAADLNVQYAGDLLAGLYVRRIEADYYIDTPTRRGIEVECVEDARVIFDDVLAEDEAPNEDTGSS